MDEEPTTFGLEPDKLANLLNICSDTSQNETKMTPDQQKMELLQDWLSETLPLDPSKKSLSKGILGHLTHIPSIISGETLRKLLNNPQTDIALIKKVKDYSKKLSKSADSEAEHDCANAIYYAAIAFALLFHDKKITKLSYKDLRDSFSRFSKVKWISSDLSKLFEKASKYCQEKIKD